MSTADRTYSTGRILTMYGFDVAKPTRGDTVETFAARLIAAAMRYPSLAERSDLADVCTGRARLLVSKRDMRARLAADTANRKRLAQAARAQR